MEYKGKCSICQIPMTISTDKEVKKNEEWICSKCRDKSKKPIKKEKGKHEKESRNKGKN